MIMLAAILSLLAVYVGIIVGIFVTTVCLILTGFGWGPLPHLYIRLVAFLQSFYPHAYPRAEARWPAIIRRSGQSSLEKHRNDSLSSFKFSTLPMKNVFDVCTDAMKAGVEAIIQDQISVAFDPSPPYYTTLLEWPGLRPFPDAPRRILKRHLFGYMISLLFRYTVLLPIRLSLCMTSFLFCSIAVIFSLLSPLTRKQQLRISVTYCRLFCASIGLVARYHNKQYRPKKSGIAVSNHLSPNDIQVIFADVDPNATDECGYTVTGQRHNGIIWAIESLVEKLCPALWLERASADDRKRFMHEVLLICQAGRQDPVLLFPEGYCSNNTRILQFRRAIFEENVVIYPIAIKQNARYGDSFWSEDYFWSYLLRIFTSWAVVYDVYYLEPMERHTPETAQQFAFRVQKQIAKYADAEPLEFDGRLWYKGEERERLKEVQVQNLAKRISKLQECDNTELL